jgi:molybdopterin converting factor subunit 1
VRIEVRLFAGAAEAVGARRLRLDLPEGATAADCLAALAVRGGDVLRRCRVAVDRRLVAPEAPLPEGAEVAVLPPVSGGALRLCRVGPEPIRAEELLAAVADPDLGGNVLFLGTVRGRTGAERTEELEYEAYEEMAEETLRRLADEAARWWPGVRLALVHRTGPVPPGEGAVGVAAAAAHRGDAFAAARFCIERLKRELPVWKRERGPDGRSRWVEHP